MAQDEYTIQIELSQPKEAVWKVITDFNAYHKWNTILLMKNNDKLEVGRKFDVTIINENGKKSKFQATTLTKDAYHSFSARQTILANWIFSATHYFIIKEIANSKTAFIQTWRFKGILFRLFKKTIFKQLGLFTQMNDELKLHLDSSLMKSVKMN